MKREQIEQYVNMRKPFIDMLSGIYSIALFTNIVFNENGDYVKTIYDEKTTKLIADIENHLNNITTNFLEELDITMEARP